MKKLIIKTKYTSVKKIASLFMVAALALSPLTSQLSLAATNATGDTSATNYPMAENLIKLISQLKLSKEQQNLIEKKLSSHKSEYESLITKRNQTKNDLLRLPTNATKAHLNALAKTQSGNLQKLIQLRVTIRQEIFTILNVQQKKQLTTQWEKIQQEQFGAALNAPQKNTTDKPKNTDKQPVKQVPAKKQANT
jgi:hypothetical protein